jgi:hypothetical protein
MNILERVFGRFMVSNNIMQKNTDYVGNEKTKKWMKKMNMKDFENDNWAKDKK